jgi:Glycosyl transferase family 2
MKLIGLMPVRNEEWCLGLSARVALEWCDEIVILLHECTDRSGEIAEEIRRESTRWRRGIGPDVDFRVHILAEKGQWDEMRHRQEMLQRARFEGATHIAMIDADEILTGAWKTVKSYVEVMDASHILTLPLYNLRGGIDRYHANGLWGNRIVSVAFKDDPLLHWGGDTFHQREPRGKRLTAFQPIAQGEGGVMHLWGASERRLLAKHALYKITERLRWPEKDPRDIEFMYSQCVKGGLRENPKEWTYTAVPESWWAPYAHWMKYLDVDAEPWQEAEVRRLVAEHGRETFAGLDFVRGGAMTRRPILPLILLALTLAWCGRDGTRYTRHHEAARPSRELARP